MTTASTAPRSVQSCRPSSPRPPRPRATEGGPMSLQTMIKAASSVALVAAAAVGQTTPAAKPAMSNYAIPIGTSVSLDDAKKAAAAASAEAKKNGWFMAIAVVDPAGTLVYYEKADTTQLGSGQVAINKARSAALYKRPTKAFQDALEKGGVNMRVLALEGAVPVAGGSRRPVRDRRRGRAHDDDRSALSSAAAGGVRPPARGLNHYRPGRARPGSAEAVQSSGTPARRQASWKRCRCGPGASARRSSHRSASRQCPT